MTQLSRLDAHFDRVKLPNFNRFNHAAVVVVGGRVVGAGTNGIAKHTNSGWIPGVHAEVAALRAAFANLRQKGKKLRRHTIIVKRDGMLNSAPCFYCSKTLAEAGTTRIWYSDNGVYVKLSVDDALKTTHISSGNNACAQCLLDDEDDEDEDKDLIRVE